MAKKCTKCPETLSKLTGTPHTTRPVREACKKAEETRDPCWLYHEFSTLEPELSQDETNYPPASGEHYKRYPHAPRLALPPPHERSGLDVLEAIRSRRSRREYDPRPLTLGEVSTLLYHTAGVTGRAWWGGPKRPYPSSGALQPAEIYPVVRGVTGVEQGLYHYEPSSHSLELLSPELGVVDRLLYEATLEQDHVVNAPLTLIVTAVLSRTARKYGWRAYRYVHWDVGFLGQNIYLVTEGLGLATVAVGAFRDRMLCRLLGIDCLGELPMLLFPVGARRS